MTLQTYGPQNLDHLALRLLDIAAIVREMANLGREHGVADLALHDKKALESCVKLEQRRPTRSRRLRGENPSGQGRRGHGKPPNKGRKNLSKNNSAISS